MEHPDNSAVTTLESLLHMKREVAQTLVAAGITTIEELAYVPMTELLAVERLDPEYLVSLRAQANEWLLSQALGGREPPTDTRTGDGEPNPIVPSVSPSPSSGGASAPLPEDNNDA